VYAVAVDAHARDYELDHPRGHAAVVVRHLLSVKIVLKTSGTSGVSYRLLMNEEMMSYVNISTSEPHAA